MHADMNIVASDNVLADDFGGQSLPSTFSTSLQVVLGAMAICLASGDWLPSGGLVNEFPVRSRSKIQQIEAMR